MIVSASGPNRSPPKDLHEGLLRHLLDVRTGGEGLFGPGEDDAADLLVRVRLGQRLAELAQKLGVERVERVGAVQPDDGDVVLEIDDDRAVGHGIALAPCGQGES
jgi:hypothetical protein